MLVALLAGSARAADPTFTPASGSPIATGGTAISVADADLNGDGKTDLAVVNQSSNNVSVLLGNGNGTFAGPTNFAVGIEPVSIVVADLNGNGRPDLAVANANEAGTGSVSILLGNGNGTFTAGSPVTVGNIPQSIAVGQLNDNVDTIPDLAVVNEGTDDVTILLGDGLGGFSTSAVSLAVGALPQSIAADDFNGDSNTDLVTANEHLNNLTILLGNGTGGFPTSSTVAVGTGPNDVASSDLNGDSRFDLAVANATSNNVSILLGNGNGTFAPVTNFAVGAGPEGTAAADYNLDGKVDLAVANTGAGPPGNLTILLGNGTGGFTASASTVPAGGEPTTVAAANLNGDAKPDLAVANYGSSNVTVQLNTSAPPPTAVALRNFVARATLKGVELRWRTAHEAGLIGFHVYRAGVKLNRTLIAARGAGATGTTYRLLDRRARVGARFTYRLQAVRADGTRVWLGRASTKR